MTKKIKFLNFNQIVKLFCQDVAQLIMMIIIKVCNLLTVNPQYLPFHFYLFSIFLTFLQTFFERFALFSSFLHFNFVFSINNNCNRNVWLRAINHNRKSAISDGMKSIALLSQILFYYEKKHWIISDHFDLPFDITICFWWGQNIKEEKYFANVFFVLLFLSIARWWFFIPCVHFVVEQSVYVCVCVCVCVRVCKRERER